MKKKKTTIIIAIVLLIVGVFAVTYAWWQLTKEQTNPGIVKTACLDIELTNYDSSKTGISLEQQWPMTNDDALDDLEGYTFNVVNHCSDSVNYVIGLETFNSTDGKELLKDSSVSLALDNELLGTYSSLTQIDKATESALKARELRTSVVAGNSTKTHNLKFWINNNSPVSEQGETFIAKLFITGGQGIENDNPKVIATDDSCFTMNNNEIVGYDFSCGRDVVIPSSVNGTAVKSIAANTFKKNTLITDADFVYYLNSSTNTIKATILKTSKEGEIKKYLKSLGNNTITYLSSDELASLDLTGYQQYSYKLTPSVSQKDANSVSYTAATADIYVSYIYPPTKTGRDGKNLFNYKFLIKDTDNEELIKKYANLYPYSLSFVSKDSTIEYITEQEFSELSGYQTDYYGLKMELESVSSNIYSVLGIDGVDFSLAKNLEIVKSGTFSTVTLTSSPEEQSVFGTDFTYSIKRVNFGANDNPITLEEAAFLFADLDSLTVYTSFDDRGAFIYSQTDTLTIKPGKNSTVLRAVPELSILETDMSAYFLTGSINLVIDEGITSVLGAVSGGVCTLPSTLSGEIPYQAFVACERLTNESIPSGVTSIGERAFHRIKGDGYIEIPAAVTSIGAGAFWLFTGEIHVMRTQADFNANVITGYDWAGDATVTFEE